MLNAALLLLLAALWGASFLFMRVAAPEFGPFSLVAIRVSLAALVLLPLLPTQPRTQAQSPPGAPSYLLLGVTNSALPFTLFAYGTLSLTAGLAAILNATAPFFGAIIAALWLRDRLTARRILGLVIGFTGVVVLFWGKASFKPSASGPATGVALLACLAAAASYGFAVNYTKRRFAGIPPLSLAAWTQLASAFVLIPLGLLFHPPAIPSLKAWCMVAALAILSTALAYILYFRLIAALGPARAITVTFLIPLFAIIWGAIFLRERITLQLVIGTITILTGTALAVWRRRERG